MDIPNDADRLFEQVRHRQQLHAQPATRRPRILRRASTARGSRVAGSQQFGSRRSLRSTGYAFAQQQGFGELITTGSMMQVRQRPRSTRAKRPPPAVAPTEMQHKPAPVRYVNAPLELSNVPDNAAAQNPEESQPKPKPLREIPRRPPAQTTKTEAVESQTVANDGARRDPSAVSRLSSGRESVAFDWSDNGPSPTSACGVQLENKRADSASAFYDSSPSKH
jgi:hypothetical protein